MFAANISKYRIFATFKPPNLKKTRFLADRQPINNRSIGLTVVKMKKWGKKFCENECGFITPSKGGG